MIQLGLEEPVHLVNLVCIGAYTAVLFAEAVEDGHVLVFHRSVSLDPGRELAADGGVGASHLGFTPLWEAEADIFVLDAFVSEEVANSLRASLKIKVDKFGFSTSSVGHSPCLQN